jgi:hypothetical protein
MNVYYTQVDVVLPRPFTTWAIIVSSGGARNTMWETYSQDAPARRTEARRSHIFIITSRITESSEMHVQTRLQLVYIGDALS